MVLKKDYTPFLEAYRHLKNVEDIIKNVAESSLSPEKKKKVLEYVISGLKSIREKIESSVS